MNKHLFIQIINTLLTLLKKAVLYKYPLPLRSERSMLSKIGLSARYFDYLVTFLFSKVDYKIINKPSHPHPGTPKSQKYQTRIVSSTGIVLRYTKRAKYKGKNTRYVYDIMIELTGSYFADLSLLEQIELIYYLNSNWKLKCHRIDVAIDDYSRKLFPVDQIIIAYLEDNHYGFQVIDDNYLDIIDNKLVGTLGIGSRYSSLFIRIYTKHKYFVRWEAEFKQKKAQKLFDKLFEIALNKTDEVTYIRDAIKALDAAAFDGISFGNKSSVSSSKNATKARTEPLPFWEVLENTRLSSIENLTNSNYIEVS